LEGFYGRDEYRSLNANLLPARRPALRDEDKGWMLRESQRGVNSPGTVALVVRLQRFLDVDWDQIER
jgi:hypothetical protein